MQKTTAKTIDEFLDLQTPERREELEKVRKLVLENLPAGYEEVLNWGMITYQVPLSVKPDTYNKKPLMFAAIASQKNHISLYLTNIYGNESNRKKFEQEYKATGKRYDMGKSCVRFKQIDDLPLDLIGRTIASTPMDQFISDYERMRSQLKQKRKIDNHPKIQG